MSFKLNKNRQSFVESLQKSRFAGRDVVTRQELQEVCDSDPSLKFPHWITNKAISNDRYATGTRATYRNPIFVDGDVYTGGTSSEAPADAPTVASESVSEVAPTPAPTPAPVAPVAEPEPDLREFIPSKDPSFVSFGFFDDLVKVIESKEFVPIFISGLSGNGKTFSVEQACARLGRELISVDITIETDSDDLIGGFRLKNGETVWEDGPIPDAMRRGAVLLINEIDLASTKIMCLQNVVDRGELYIKKIKRLVKAVPGFQIIATANTKGRGSVDGRFIGAGIMNESFLERFPITFDHNYPDESTEVRILKRNLNAREPENVKFLKRLAKWAVAVRKAFKEDAVEDVISTRRLVQIVKCFNIFENQTQSVALCVNRFDGDTKDAFIGLYDAIDDTEPEAIPDDSVTDPDPDSGADLDNFKP